MWFMQNAFTKPDNAGAGATDYMHLLGLVALGYMWARIAKAALARQAEGPVRDDGRQAGGRPLLHGADAAETGMRLTRIKAGSDTTMALGAEAF